MSTNDKTMLYLTDLPYRISILDIQDFVLSVAVAVAATDD